MFNSTTQTQAIIGGSLNFVATPQGLAQILRDKSWKYLYTAEILALPQYDLEEIRRAVVTRVVTDNEFFKGKQEPQEESL
jgi:hypothetical protein